MLPHHNRFLNTMGLCRILLDAHMFYFIHPAENHTKQSLLIIHNFLNRSYQLYLCLSSVIEACKFVPQPSAQVTGPMIRHGSNFDCSRPHALEFDHNVLPKCYRTLTQPIVLLSLRHNFFPFLPYWVNPIGMSM
jgi:hypothetical protein